MLQQNKSKHEQHRHRELRYVNSMKTYANTHTPAKRHAAYDIATPCKADDRTLPSSFCLDSDHIGKGVIQSCTRANAQKYKTVWLEKCSTQGPADGPTFLSRSCMRASAALARLSRSCSSCWMPGNEYTQAPNCVRIPFYSVTTRERKTKKRQTHTIVSYSATSFARISLVRASSSSVHHGLQPFFRQAMHNSFKPFTNIQRGTQLEWLPNQNV